MGNRWKKFEKEYDEKARVYDSNRSDIWSMVQEILGKEEQQELQRVETKYWKLVLGSEWNIPQYIAQEEVVWGEMVEENIYIQYVNELMYSKQSQGWVNVQSVERKRSKIFEVEM